MSRSETKPRSSLPSTIGRWRKPNSCMMKRHSSTLSSTFTARGLAVITSATPGWAGWPPTPHYAVHDVALGKDSRQFSISKHSQSANVVFHHEASGFQHGAGSVDRINFAVFHKLAEGKHELSLTISSGCRTRRPGQFAGENYSITQTLRISRQCSRRKEIDFARYGW